MLTRASRGCFRVGGFEGDFVHDRKIFNVPWHVASLNREVITGPTCESWPPAVELINIQLIQPRTAVLNFNFDKRPIRHPVVCFPKDLSREWKLNLLSTSLFNGYDRTESLWLVQVPVSSYGSNSEYNMANYLFPYDSIVNWFTFFQKIVHHKTSYN